MTEAGRAPSIEELEAAVQALHAAIAAMPLEDSERELLEGLPGRADERHEFDEATCAHVEAGLLPPIRRAAAIVSAIYGILSEVKRRGSRRAAESEDVE